MAISQDISQPLIIEFSLKITLVNFHSHLPGDNELTHCGLVAAHVVIDPCLCWFYKYSLSLITAGNIGSTAMGKVDGMMMS